MNVTSARALFMFTSFPVTVGALLRELFIFHGWTAYDYDVLFLKHSVHSSLTVYSCRLSYIIG